MNILYIITIVSIYILFMLMRKTEEKQNIIKWSAISGMLILCYNIITCLILTFLNILCTLKNLSICNIVVIISLLGILMKTKKVQKYYCKVSEVIFCIVLLILVIFIGYKQYDYPVNIKYHITDGSTHYFFAQQFYENSTLLFNETTDDFLGIYNSNFRLPGAYINEGILFKVFDDLIPEINLFIIFDLLVLYISGILFYYLLKTHSKGHKFSFLAAIFALLYSVGYQLNSMIYGYVYLSLALNIVITFLLLMASREKENIESTIAIPILSLTSLGIFFSYAYFIPIIYVAIIIHIITKSVRNKEKILSAQNVSIIIYLIIIPLILGISYFIIFPLIRGIESEINTIGVDGAIYENYITNYLALLPILIISIIIGIKNKEKTSKDHFPKIIFICSIVFAILLFIGYKLEIVSKYYFLKSYYIIWIMFIYNIYVEISNLLERRKKSLKIFAYVNVFAYFVAIIVSTFVLNKNIGINDIFYSNLELIQQQEYILHNEELEIMEKYKNITEGDETYILSSNVIGRMYWMSVISKNQYLYIDFITGFAYDIELWLTEREDKYYFAYYEDYNKIMGENNSIINENDNRYKIIHNDKYGFILERK